MTATANLVLSEAPTLLQRAGDRNGLGNSCCEPRYVRLPTGFFLIVRRGALTPQAGKAAPRRGTAAKLRRRPRHVPLLGGPTLAHGGRLLLLLL